MSKNKEVAVNPSGEKDYELECLMRSIKEVEVAKQKKPELYQKALSELKGEAKAITSIEDLKAIRQAKAEGEDEDAGAEDDADGKDA